MRTHVERLWLVFVLVDVVAIGPLAFPYLASAYYLEAGGQALHSPEQPVRIS